MATLHDALFAARARLVDAGIAADEAVVDVEVYACTILGWDRARLLSDLRQPEPSALEPRFSQWLARREQREPTAYIVGRREFWGLDFIVSPAVLIPRPETELIVEEALACLGSVRATAVVDVGTGSGCVGVAIASELTSARVAATDISREALVVARENAARHGVDRRMRFVHTSYLDGLSGPFDAIVSNPPYVKESDKPALPRQVGGYEPHVALFGGADGLRGIIELLDAARTKLTAGGHVIFEFGLGEDDRICDLVARYPTLALERLREDIQGIARTAVVRRVN